MYEWKATAQAPLHYNVLMHFSVSFCLKVFFYKITLAPSLGLIERWKHQKMVSERRAIRYFCFMGWHLHFILFSLTWTEEPDDYRCMVAVPYFTCNCPTGSINYWFSANWPINCEHALTACPNQLQACPNSCSWTLTNRRIDFTSSFIRPVCNDKRHPLH